MHYYCSLNMDVISSIFFLHFKELQHTVPEKNVRSAVCQKMYLSDSTLCFMLPEKKHAVLVNNEREKSTFLSATNSFPFVFTSPLARPSSKTHSPAIFIHT